MYLLACLWKDVNVNSLKSVLYLCGEAEKVIGCDVISENVWMRVDRRGMRVNILVLDADGAASGWRVRCHCEFGLVCVSWLLQFREWKMKI